MVPSQDKSLMQTSLSFCFGDKGTALQSTDFDQLWKLTQGSLLPYSLPRYRNLNNAGVVEGRGSVSGNR